MSGGYHAVVHAVLVTPIGIDIPGNGLSQRCAMWFEALSEIGEVTRIVVPIVGPPDDAPGVIVVDPSIDRWAVAPELARGVTPHVGRCAGNGIYEALDNVDLVVGVRSYLGHMCIGLKQSLAARLIIDLDDDDASFFDARGEHEEAERFRRLVKLLSSEADCLTSVSGFGESLQLANGVELPPSIHRIQSNKTKRNVLFLGNMGYQPNVDAATLLIEEIAPEILRQCPDVNVEIAGPGSEKFGAHGLGFVENLSELMGRTDVLVVPLQEGSGTRIKILDAWAHEVPVVSTSIGAEGLGARDQENILIADDNISFADVVVRVLKDSTLAEHIAKNGRAEVAANFSREHVIAVAKNIVHDTLGGLFADSSAHHIVPIAIDTLHFTETDRGVIVLNTSTGDVHELEGSAAVIFSLIDGKSTSTDIANEVQRTFELDELPIEVVESVIADLVEIGLVLRIRLHGDGLRFE